MDGRRVEELPQRREAEVFARSTLRHAARRGQHQAIQYPNGRGGNALSARLENPEHSRRRGPAGRANPYATGPPQRTLRA
jgi:hypothetical protein